MVPVQHPGPPTNSVYSHRVELLTRPDCHLCADARSVVSLVCDEFGLSWREVSAVDEPDLLEQFAEEIPVLFIDGVQRDFWKIDPTRLRSLLAQ